MSDYSMIDNHPLLLQYLFYPRKSDEPAPEGAFDHLVKVEEAVSVGCRFFEGNPGWGWLLYFHGNGEIAADYNEIAPQYHRLKINLVVADYRGYGQSGGKPSFGVMGGDARAVYEEVSNVVRKRGCPEDLWVMGRSMGSISALELAAAYGSRVKGVIFESGFISVTRLIRHLGLPAGGLNLEPLERQARALAGRISIPALIIHGERDSLVPYEQAEELFDSLGTGQKELIGIPGGDHNNLMFMGHDLYFSSIGKFLEGTGTGNAGKS